MSEYTKPEVVEVLSPRMPTPPSSCTCSGCTTHKVPNN